MQTMGDAGASYTIENISLEFDMVTQLELAWIICTQYAGRLAMYMHDPVLLRRMINHGTLTSTFPLEA